MEIKFVTIIIPTYKEWEILNNCIKALSSQSYCNENFEVIIVNNDSVESIPNDLELPNNFKLISEIKPGSYAARNAGLKIARGEIIGFTDSDCIPDKDWIKNAVNYFNEHKYCSRIAGNICIFFESQKPTISELYDKFYAFPQKKFVNHSGTSVTANMFTYKIVFEKVGIFNESLMSGGDFLWGNIAHLANYRIEFVEEIIVYHPGSKSLSKLIQKEIRYGGGMGQFFKKNKFIGINLLKFIYNLRIRLREIQYIIKAGKNISFSEKFRLILLRHYLLSMRAFEKFKVQLGKKPNRT